jgi:hypothetical protein
MFNLPDEIRIVSKGQPNGSPQSISAEVIERMSDMPNSTLLEVLSVCLPNYVRLIVTSWPTGGNGSAGGAKAGSKPRSGHNQGKAKSDRVAAWAEEIRSDKVNLGNSVWKTFNNCTPADLRSGAESRRIKGDQNYAAAQRFEDLAEYLEQKGAKSISKLTDKDLHEHYHLVNTTTL